MDATVSWGGPDYKFTNDTLYPIKIVTSYSGGYLTVKIPGNQCKRHPCENDQQEAVHRQL